MGQAQIQPRLTLAEYLDWENRQAERHEFVGGEVYAMVGARRVHGVVSLNVASTLKAQLRGSPCRVFAESMKLRVDDDIFYPDVFVTCDARDLRTEQVFTAPTLVAEVLSPSTEAYDRGLKFTAYRRLDSLREYLLIDPDSREVQLFRRGADGLFTLHDLSGAAAFDCASIGCRLSAEDLFDGLDADSGSDSADPSAGPPAA
ncbi:MAG TPA: Uma2 family endonuclease [Burkholderiaceae bacterium]|nr:Uma2 family endonuclease [Burkholderiaceae bacterium]HMX09633.1 Uma2 family endonuclease [Burkholderiaceae bacterium]HMY98097.1 Uma2 family endonuclease [Burkholderiaceae bacterium]HNB42685.1 Uma2 family endonuclease [Burkholderiaceae bacterium]HNG78181.1 Uma2 family endonuclease [Burkholderiaceae bacterium]